MLRQRRLPKSDPFIDLPHLHFSLGGQYLEHSVSIRMRHGSEDFHFVVVLIINSRMIADRQTSSNAQDVFLFVLD
ncbi:hypothetical protein KSP9073_01454 [Kushneria phyllosphaerae]|uniref:Uncharacterized protein n=1 Tax=Kushneria phyllosphaerae TaxID=2100822 RepID=A0A2R8CKP2_9GAMM|nr:hypothetical protein KSP9073_01454 [Kushneria phyllosphaerae]